MLPPLLLAACLTLPLPALAYLDVPMSVDTARALEKRFGTGPTEASLYAATTTSPRQYIDRAWHEPPRYPPPVAEAIAGALASRPLEALWQRYAPGLRLAPAERQQRRREALALQRSAAEIRLLETVNSDNPPFEALLNFWLAHFAVEARQPAQQAVLADYGRTLAAALADDSFAALLKASFFHPAMQLTAGPPGRPGHTDRLARRLFDLTLGPAAAPPPEDIHALARILSGSSLPLPTESHREDARYGIYRLDPGQHDAGTKRLLGEHYPAGHGVDEVERALEQLARHPSTAREVAHRLARHFMADHPPEALVKAMAEGFRASGGRLSRTLHPLLSSRAFHDSLRQPSLPRTPIDYLVATTRAVCNDQPVTHGALLVRLADQLGEMPYPRPSSAPPARPLLSPAARQRYLDALTRQRLPLAAPPARAPTPHPGRACPVILPALRHLGGPAANEADNAAALLASPAFTHR